MMTITRELLGRREVLGGAIGGGAMLMLAGCSGRSAPQPDRTPEFAAIHRTLGGGRLGVAAIDVDSGARLGFDADSRYALCSTFKLPLAAAVLARVDGGDFRLDRRIAITAADLVEHAPVVERAVGRDLTVGELCAAAMRVSDNAAANLLLPLVGGPAGLTAFARAHGDASFRLDRTEPTLNTNLPGDPRDTDTPAAMASLVARLLTTGALGLRSRAYLTEWMGESATGLNRLRAGLPEMWKTGDRTGTGGNGAVNDIAIAWPPLRRGIVIVSFIDAPAATLAACEQAHAAVARVVARQFG